MKHGKKLSVRTKEFLQAHNIDPKQYLQVKNMANELHFVHRKTKNLRIFKREDGNWYESNRHS